MLISKENYEVDSKSINHVTSKKDGKEYDLNTLYLKDDNGTITTLVVRNNIYEKAEKGKTYKLKAILDYNGKLSINDIELQK